MAMVRIKVSFPSYKFNYIIYNIDTIHMKKLRTFCPKALITAIIVLISSVCAASDLLARSAPPPPFAVMRGRAPPHTVQL